jgi:hypothetical protein
MRALISKVMTGSMVAGAALLVAACSGGGDDAANNVATDDLGTEALDTTNDVTAIDAGTGADLNMAVDTGADANAAANATTDTTGNMTNGM